MASAPEIERVEWRSVSAGELQVEVTGRWPVVGRGQSPVLRVGPGHEAQAFPAREVRWGGLDPAEAAERGPGGEQTTSFRAAFAVPVGLRREIVRGLAMRIGTREIALPGARAAAAGAPSFTGLAPNVIDPTVLAERRARRAELSEETLARRAAQAEAQVEDLEAQLDQLEHQLEHALAERDRLATALSARERELRVVRQREYSEQQLRVEAEEQRGRAEREAEAEVGALRRRLAAAEGRVADVEDELEKARRQAAESEYAAEAPLRAELSRRRQIQEHVRVELDALRAELEGLRVRAEEEAEGRAQADLHTGELTRELEVLRAELDSRGRALAEAERDAASLRTRLDDLSETLDHERRQHLEIERDLREQLEAQAAAVQETLDELRADIDRAANDLRVRERREGELEALLAEFVNTATTLREAFERGLANVRSELEARVTAERESHARELTHLEDRVAELRRQLEHPSAVEPQGAEPTRGGPASPPGPDREGPEAAQGRGAGRTHGPHPERAADRNLDRGEGSARAPIGPGASETTSAGPLAADLAEAFRRLREQVSEVAAQARQPTDRPPPDRQREPGPGPRSAGPAPLPEAPEAAPIEPSRPREGERPEPAGSLDLGPFAPPAATAQGARRGRGLHLGRLRRAAPGPSWLASGIARMARSGDPRGAARLLIEVLPVQGVLVDGDLSYEVELLELGSYSVTIRGGTAEVESLTPGAEPESGPTAFQVSGEAAELAPLAGGSAPRRLHRVSVSGHRRRLHRLLKDLRRPVSLVDLMRADVHPDPLLLLRALAAMIEPDWTAGRRFSVAYVVEDGIREPESHYRVEVRPGESVRVVEESAATVSPPLAATARIATRALLPLLAGLPLPAGEEAQVEGDAGTVLLLSSWIERAQADPAPSR